VQHAAERGSMTGSCEGDNDFSAVQEIMTICNRRASCRLHGLRPPDKPTW